MGPRGRHVVYSGFLMIPRCSPPHILVGYEGRGGQFPFKLASWSEHLTQSSPHSQAHPHWQPLHPRSFIYLHLNPAGRLGDLKAVLRLPLPSKPCCEGYDMTCHSCFCHFVSLHEIGPCQPSLAKYHTVFPPRLHGTPHARIRSSSPVPLICKVGISQDQSIPAPPSMAE